MLPELGHFALILAMLLAALQCFFGIAGPHLGRERWMAAVTPAVAGQFVMVATAVACLIYSFISNDFSVTYVAETSNSALPLFYRATAMWGAHEGSMLLWIFILSCWTLAVAIGVARLPAHFGARVLGVLGFVSFGFLLFTLATSNPLLRIDPPVPDGNDLNPLLQDPSFVIHPPMLYIGWTGFGVAFAFACAAMLEGKLDQTWARWMRPWATAAWAFLGCGIALGSWWAYYVLGWGGYWGWDPVENASFMPWLVGTALIHSLAVTEKRGLFKSWTLLLALLAFSLALIGTFLTRSGVTLSVHSFAADPRRGMFILAFLIVLVGGSLTLYAWRAPRLKSQAGFELLSREAFLLFNNILLVIAAATVFLGTLAPMIATAVGLGTLSVGPPYFNPTFLVSMLPLLALVAVGIHARWKKGRLGEHQRVLAITLVAAAVLGCALIFGVYSGGHVLAPVGATLGLWIVLSSLIDPIDRLRRKLTLSRAVLGMTLAHVGLGLTVIALTTVQSFTVERDVALAVGGSAQVGGYEFRLDAMNKSEGPNYDVLGGTVVVSRHGQPLATLYPELRRYWVRQEPIKHSAIKMEGGSNLLVAMGQELGAGRWSLRIQVRPLVNLVWLGAFIMALGGFLAASDRRYRTARVPQPQPQGQVAPVAAGSEAG